MDGDGRLSDVRARAEEGDAMIDTALHARDLSRDRAVEDFDRLDGPRIDLDDVPDVDAYLCAWEEQVQVAGDRIETAANELIRYRALYPREVAT